MAFNLKSVPIDGPDAQGYSWRLTHEPIAPTIHRDVDVYLNCGLEPGAKSCARRDEERRTCDVYLPSEPAAWLEEHEKRHCAGWIH